MSEYSQSIRSIATIFSPTQTSLVDMLQSEYDKGSPSSAFISLEEHRRDISKVRWVGKVGNEWICDAVFVSPSFDKNGMRAALSCKVECMFISLLYFQVYIDQAAQWSARKKKEKNQLLAYRFVSTISVFRRNHAWERERGQDVVLKKKWMKITTLCTKTKFTPTNNSRMFTDKREREREREIWISYGSRE